MYKRIYLLTSSATAHTHMAIWHIALETYNLKTRQRNRTQRRYLTYLFIANFIDTYQGKAVVHRQLLFKVIDVNTFTPTFKTNPI